MQSSAALRNSKTTGAVPWRDRALFPLQPAAEVAGVSVASLYKYEQEGLLRFRRLGGRTLVETASLIKLIDSAKPWTPSTRGAAARTARIEAARAAWQS